MERQKEIIEFGKFRLDVAECALFRDQLAVPLEPQVFKTLLVLVENAGHLVDKARLLDEIWGDAQVEEGNLVRNISLLRKALGESRLGERYIETVPKRGYRFVAQVRDADAANKSHQRAALLGGSAYKVQSPNRRTVYVAAAVVMSLALAAAAFYPMRGGRNAASPERGLTSIAVLPFKPLTGGERDEELETGMAEALINKLSTVPELTVRPLGVAQKYAALEDPVAAGREMGVDAVLESTLQKSADEFRVTSRLLRVTDGAALWTYRSNEPQENLLAMQDLLSEKVASSLVASLSAEQRAVMGRNYTHNAEAYQLYLKGRFFFEKVTPDGVRKSIGYFQEAIDKDPNFALAYCGMCASYTLFGHLRVLRPQEAFPAAKAALARALELDESLSEAHAQMGFIALHYDYDWHRADKEFGRAIELNPDSPMAHHGRAFYLAAIGRTDEALVEIKKAQDLNPVSLHLNSDAGLILYYAHRYEDAIAQLERTQEMGPDFALAARYLARVYGHKRMEALAVAEYQRSAGPLGLTAVHLRSTKASAVPDLDSYYRLELDRLKKQVKERYVPPLDLARLYAILGDRDHAFEWLARAIDDRNYAIPFLKVDPDFDNVRPDHRFADLLRRIGLGH
ncbi:MAG: winged helix-turn-helix domain-containing protein [Blastocatellia bacterium]